ncbi:MAG: AAA family ATPase [Candidatus Cloacimonetes bacterium]|nr:AAA family ATPase [Candidatus Cloacimonadota bacterium]
MRLKEVVIHNFRGFYEPSRIPVDACITGLIGRNDAGKSSILEALGVFFELDSIKLEKDDFCVSDPDCLIEITCIFDQIPDRVMIDTTNETDLLSEFFLNSNGDLEIKKIYKRTQTAKPQVMIIANHPTVNGYSDLHLLDNEGLKGRAELLDVDISTIDKRKNAEIRKAIWNHCVDLKISTQEMGVNSFKGDSEKLTKKIMGLLPLYQLFKVERETKDSDPVAKSPLQDAVDLAKKELAEQISELEEMIKKRVIERADKTLEKLREMDSSLASELKPKFKTNPKWTFDFTLDGDDNVPINKRGSGVRRLILLNFFRAEAERQMAEKDAPSVIYAFEEPETSQHPNNQEMLVEAFKEISLKDNCQVMLTTHVPALGSMLPISGIRYVTKVKNTSRVEYGDAEILDKIAKSLGILPNQIPKGAKAIILVEGPSDVDFLIHAAHLLKQKGEIAQTFEDKSICFLIAGGCGTVKHWLSRNLIDKIGVDWGLFLDSDRTDTTFSKQNADYVEKMIQDGRKAHLTRMREIENYLDVSVLGAPEGSITITETSDVKMDVNRVLKVAKTDIIERFWPKMDFELMRKRETYEDSGGIERHELTEIIKDFLTLV